MGKPYAAELSRLSDTYDWALGTPIEPLTTAISNSGHLPLVAVGSGGSLTAAHLACSLHQRYTGLVSRSLTPLELVSCRLHLRSLSTMILSARGSNVDVISALEDAIVREPRRCLVLSLRRGSRLARLARSYRFVDLLEFDPPTLKDGFLATNSLLAFAVLLTRAYSESFAPGEKLPRDLDELIGGSGRGRAYIDDLRASCAPLWRRQTIVVLYGATASTAAVDFESKFAEAALGNVQLADFRNFAHGRHNWLAKRAPKTGVLAMFAEDERSLAEKTLRLIPTTVPIIRICLPNTGETASIAALVVVLYLVGAAGERHGIDPGRPRVPPFGRRIYRLPVIRGLKQSRSGIQLAIARKLGVDGRDLRRRLDLPFWEEAYGRFLESLTGATFGAVLLDYDGTLCDEADRFAGPREEVVGELARLLKDGLLLGVATGRGDSARNDLRRVLPPEVWEGVHMGYYNGSDVGLLSDNGHPDATAPAADSLKTVSDGLATHPVISRFAWCKAGRNQISVRPSSEASGELVWRLVQQLARKHRLAALRSTHSIDVLRPEVSKGSLLSHIQGLLPEVAHVLAIGDKGQWPGNDCDMLAAPYSLSVDDVSADPGTCWNLAPAGHRGTQALLGYLRRMRPEKDGFRFVLPNTGGPA